MNIQFITRATSKSIYYRCSNGLSLTKILPFKLNPLDIWNRKSQSTNSNHYINKELFTFKSYLLDEINKAKLLKKIIDKELIIKLHNNYFNPIKEYEPTLLQYLEIYKTNCKLSSSGLKRLGTLKTKLKGIAPIKIIDCDLNWITNFTHELLKKKYAESSINKHLQIIKQIIKYADINDLQIRRNILSFKMLKTSSVTHYLNEDEVTNLFKFTPPTDSLNNVKKLFLIGCTTGLRISDLMKIKSFNISNDMLELITQKTKQNIVIPLDPRIKGFIDEIYPLSHPVFNRKIKDLFKAMGLNYPVEGYLTGANNMRVLGIYPKYKVLTSHAMRRTFASNLYGKLPTVVIMGITGHKTEKSFLTYIKKGQRHFAEQLKEFYEKNY